MGDREHHEGCAVQGIYRKFEVRRVDGSRRHDGCEYFVLDLTHDPAARSAALAFAGYAAHDRPKLAAELGEKVQRIEQEQEER